jgi:Erv1 / Alr family
MWRAPSYQPTERNPMPTHALSKVLPEYTNPKYIGPGMWVSIHTLAKGATTYEKKKAFVDYMNTLRASFPCPECRKHLSAYLDSHPFDAYWSLRDPATQEDTGMFRYSVDFHNAVNVRLKKPIMDWETARALYYESDNAVCAADCHGAH